MTSILNLAMLAAEGAPAAAENGNGQPILFQFIVPLIIVFGIMYVFIIAPQRKREKHRRQMLSALGKGDEVVTIGGLRGTISKINEEEVVLEVDENVNMTFSRGAIASVVEGEKKSKD